MYCDLPLGHASFHAGHRWPASRLSFASGDDTNPRSNPGQMLQTTSAPGFEAQPALAGYLGDSTAPVVAGHWYRTRPRHMEQVLEQPPLLSRCSAAVVAAAAQQNH